MEYNYEEEVTLINNLVAKANSSIVNYARNVLYYFGYERAIPTLRHILRDESQSARLRSWSGMALGQLQDFESQSVLIEILGDTRQASLIRLGAAEGLIAMGSQEGFAALISALDERDKEFCLDLLEILKNLEGTLPTTHLISFIKTAQNAEIAVNTLRVLENLDSKLYFETIEDLIETKKGLYPAEIIYTLNWFLTFNSKFTIAERIKANLQLLFDYQELGDLEELVGMSQNLVLLYFAELQRKEGWSPFLSILQDENLRIVAMMVAVLDKIGDKCLLPSLQSLQQNTLNRDLKDRLAGLISKIQTGEH